MKKLITLLFVSTLSYGFAQSSEELVKTAIEFQDVKTFLLENAKGEIYLRDKDGFVSLKDGKRRSSSDENQSNLVLESIIEDRDKFKLKFSIDDYIVGKVTILAVGDELKVRRALLKAGEGENKSRMISFEF